MAEARDDHKSCFESFEEVLHPLLHSLQPETENCCPTRRPCGEYSDSGRGQIGLIARL